MSLNLIVLLVFIGSASILSFLLYMVWPKKTIVEERMEGLAVRESEAAVMERPLSGWQKFLEKLGRGVPMGPKEHGKYTRHLIAAGYRKERLPVFMGAKIFLTVALPAAYLFLYGLPIEKNPKIMLLIAVALALAGFLLPTYWLSGQMKKRQLRIFHDLPDVLDLMTVCVEAGLSMEAAMLKIGEDPQFSKSPLARELRTSIQETRAGKPRLDALRDMGERSMVDDLKAFAAMLIQTERLGTSLVQSLRVHADSLRTIRRQKAEEAAAKTAVKLIFPLVFFVFPALLVVILGPGVVKIYKVLIAD